MQELEWKVRLITFFLSSNRYGLCLIYFFLTTGICRILGIPKPLGLLLAAIVGSFVSTTVKAEGRMADKSSTYTFNPKVIHEAIAREVRFSDKSSAELITAREGRFFHSTNGESITNMDASVASSEPLRSWSPYFYGDGEFIVNMDPPRTAKVLMPRIKAGKSSISSDSMTFSEVAGDITKWMIFDSLSTNSEWTSRIIALTLNDGSYMHVLSGSVAAVAGKYVQDLSTSRKCGLNSRRVPTPTSVRYAKTAFEGGVLFGTYKATLAFLNSVVPDDWNKEFLFQVVLENVEKTLPGL